jgi:hypothetical protein
VKDSILSSKDYSGVLATPLLTNLARAQMEMGMKDAAVATMDEMLTRYEGGPESPEALCARGVRNVFSGDLDAAERYFLMALAKRPRNETFHANLDRLRAMKAKLRAGNSNQ